MEKPVECMEPIEEAREKGSESPETVVTDPVITLDQRVAHHHKLLSKLAVVVTKLSETQKQEEEKNARLQKEFVLMSQYVQEMRAAIMDNRKACKAQIQQLFSVMKKMEDVTTRVNDHEEVLESQLQGLRTDREVSDALYTLLGSNDMESC